MKEKLNNLIKSKSLSKNTTELLKEVRKSINKNALTEYMLIDLSRSILKRPYKEGEKVDIVFIFQVASFWPSWESLWKACVEDERLNPIMLVCDDGFPQAGLNQFKTAKNFLKTLNIPFRDVNEVNLDSINPHIIVLHTPYDGQRPRYLQGKQLAAKGYRTIYVSYGIEIADTAKARIDHFTTGAVTTAWRLYTFSKEMIPYYKMFSPTGGDMVRSFGHPKFDYLTKEHFPSLPEDIAQQVNGRKVLLLKVHFPKKVNGKMITPSLDMYENFIKSLPQYKNLFCIFMPHPKFYEELSKFKDVKKFKELIEETENLVEFNGDDYRPVIMNCDYYIVDRSAIMIEVGVTGKPILYVHTKEPEAMTAPVEKIINSYYQASTGKELIDFMNEVVIPDQDPRKEERMSAFNSVVPNMQGKSGYLIKEDIINSLKNEKELNKEVIDTKFSDQFREHLYELYHDENICEARVIAERERIKRHLSYRLGQVLIESSKEPFGILKLPKKLKQAYADYKNNK